MLKVVHVEHALIESYSFFDSLIPICLDFYVENSLAIAVRVLYVEVQPYALRFVLGN